MVDDVEGSLRAEAAVQRPPFMGAGRAVRTVYSAARMPCISSISAC